VNDSRILRVMAALVEFGVDDLGFYSDLEAAALQDVVQRHEQHFVATSRHRRAGGRWRVKDLDALRSHIRELGEVFDEAASAPDVRGALDHLARAEYTALGARRLLETLDAVDAQFRHHVQDTVAAFIRECIELLTATVVDLSSGEVLPSNGDHEVIHVDRGGAPEVDLTDEARRSAGPGSAIVTGSLRIMEQRGSATDGDASRRAPGHQRAPLNDGVSMGEDRGAA
jgi:hypothetical protein